MEECDSSSSCFVLKNRSVANVCTRLRQQQQQSSSSLSLVLLDGSWNPNSNRCNVSELPSLFSKARTAACCRSADKESANDFAGCPLMVSSTTIDHNDETGIFSAIHDLQSPEELPALVLVATINTHNTPLNNNPNKQIVLPIADLSARVLSVYLQQQHPNTEQYKAVYASIYNALQTIVLGGGEDLVPKLPPLLGHTEALRIFVSGDRSQVGKSSVCMGLIGTLVQKLGYPPESVAYIKPATQCEATQLVALYCEDLGVAHRAIGPIVYYKGFTRAFLEGATDSTEVLLDRAGAAVDELAKNKRVVIVDGVGYPAVGSICGTDNASVAASCGPFSQNKRLPVPVVLVGKQGVGDAVDSFNLNATYFESKGVPVVGSVFNRLPLEGYYSLDNCKQAVGSYFKRLSNKNAFGFIPEVQSIAESRNVGVALELDAAKEFVSTFGDHVDVQAILLAVSEATKRSRRAATTTSKIKTPRPIQQQHNNPVSKRPRTTASPPTTAITTRVRLTREQVEKAAQNAGAAGG